MPFKELDFRREQHPTLERVRPAATKYQRDQGAPFAPPLTLDSLPPYGVGLRNCAKAGDLASEIHFTNPS